MPPFKALRYLGLVLLAFVACQAAVAAAVLTVRAPIAAEYFLLQTIQVKEALLARMPSPRVIFLGGSSSMFGIDAAAVSAALHIETMNMGLHGGLRFDRFAQVARETVRQGDLLVMPLEPPYYSCAKLVWSHWSVRNAIAWDREYFDQHSLGQRLLAAWSGGEDIELLWEMAEQRLRPNYDERNLKRRLAILFPTTDPLVLFRETPKSEKFEYSVFNTDERGDMLHTEAAARWDDTEPAGVPPSTICPPVVWELRQFASDMRARGVSVVVAHTPYLTDKPADPADLAQADASFAASLASIGLPVIDASADTVFPRRDFFDMAYHLNAEARARRTARLIESLRHYLCSGHDETLAQFAALAPQCGPQ